MRILYGVAGEGFGHSSRAKRIIPYLQRKGHSVLVVTYGQAYDVLYNEFDVLKIAGFTIAFEEGNLDKSQTVKKGIDTIIENLKDWRKIKREVEKFNPELCITDMEPIVPVIRKLYKLPLICFDNQHRLTHLELNVPGEYKKDYIFAREIVNRFVSKADAFVIVSFVKSRVRKDGGKVRVVSPLIRSEVLEARKRAEYGGNVLVYMTKPNKDLISVLRESKENFVVYGYGRKVREGNIIFKETGAQFLEDLVEAKAIIATAGFTLMSEALYLKKPYFAIPLRGQFEQTLNALFLSQSGLGDYSEKPSLEDIARFLGSLELYERRLSKHSMRPDESLDAIDWAVGKAMK
ncbi:MAG: glycosyltransferase family protein [Nanoarchaeota archaeon]